MRDTTAHWYPLGLWAIDHYPLDLTDSPIPNPRNSLPSKSISIPFREKNVVGNHIKSFTEVQTDALPLATDGHHRKPLSWSGRTCPQWSCAGCPQWLPHPLYSMQFESNNNKLRDQFTSIIKTCSTRDYGLCICMNTLITTWLLMIVS